MKQKQFIAAIIGVFLAFFITARLEAVDTKQIDQIRLYKEVLTSQDRDVIDKFLAQAVREMVNTRDFTEIAQIRTTILTRQSKQVQYAQQFSESAYKHIFSGLQQAEKLPEEYRFKVILNLLILIENLQDARLIDLALPLLKHDNRVVRYWAVRCVTNPAIFNRDSSAEQQLAGRIIKRLGETVSDSSPEALAAIIQFAAKINDPAADDLLLHIADVRIRKYAGWTVEYELLDEAVLKLLYSKTSPLSVVEPEIARRFAQLYSFVMQRYIKGQNFLGGLHRQYLASVLVEIEQDCIGKLMDKPQSTIKTAIEKADYSALLMEHNRLFGDQTTAGELPARLNFDYGTNPDGSKRTFPVTLSEPPKREKPAESVSIPPKK